VLSTQVDIIQSHNVALRVVDTLHLADVATVRSQFLSQTHGNGSLRDWAADQLLRQLRVVPSPESNVIVISYANRDPQAAAAFANAFANAYLAANLDLTVEPARRQATWFQDQVAGLRLQLEAAQRRLADYQQQQGLIGGTDRLNAENARYTELSTELGAEQGQLADAESRLKAMEDATASGQLQQLPDVLNNQLLQSLKADLVHAEAELAEIGEKKGAAHPDYQTARARVLSLRSKLNGELQTATGSIRQAAQIAQQRVSELQNELDQQKTRILQQQQQHDTMNVLAQEVQNAQRAYDAVAARATDLQLESQQIQTRVAILNPAIAPTEPASPRLLANSLLGLMLGVVLGVTAALTLELFDRRVRAPRDIAELAGMPVLAWVPRALPGIRSPS
jgi:chain length determinant protein EpsF